MKDLNIKIEQLIDIRKYCSKKWYFNVEMPPSCEVNYDENGNIIMSDDVLSLLDLADDELYETLFK